MSRNASVAGVVVLSLFALPFIGMGLFAAVTFAMAAHSNGDPKGYLAAVFASMFAVIGFGIIAAAVAGFRASKRVESLQVQYPDSPWMWRDDWGMGRAPGRRGAAIVGIWIAAAFVDLIVITVGLTAGKELVGDPRMYVLAVFAVIAAALTAKAVQMTLRRKRYGNTWFEFTPGSLVPGSPMRGTIHMKLAVETPHGIDLKLNCVRRIVTGSGKSQTVNEEVLWSDQRSVDGSMVQRAMSDEGLLPVEFMIPADAYESNDADSRDQVIWKLHASADVSGVDFDDEYVIPVYRNAEIPQMTAAASFAGVLPMDVVAPPTTKVVVKQDERGTVFEFGAFRNPKTSAFLLIFTAVWGGVVYMLFTKTAGGPIWMFRVFFGLSLLLIIYGLLSSIFGKAEIIVAENLLTIRKSLLGISNTKKFTFEDIARVAVSDNAQHGAMAGSNCGVQFALTSGGKLNIAAGTLSRDEAMWWRAESRRRSVATIALALSSRQRWQRHEERLRSRVDRERGAYLEFDLSASKVPATPGALRLIT